MKRGDFESQGPSLPALELPFVSANVEYAHWISLQFALRCMAGRIERNSVIKRGREREEDPKSRLDIGDPACVEGRFNGRRMALEKAGLARPRKLHSRTLYLSRR